MEILKIARLKKSFSLRQLGELSGVNFRTLSEVEAGSRLPTLEIVERLSRVLGPEFSMPIPSPWRVKRLAKSIAAPRPFQLECGHRPSWDRVFKVHRDLLAQLRSVPEIPTWFFDSVRLDSLDEGVAWIQFFAAGATADLGSPQEMGFRRHPVLDSRNRCLGERALPYVIWKTQLVSALIWPQVTLRAGELIYRPDGLALLRTPPRRRLEVLLEFDGKGHDPSRDEYRAKQLDMPILRCRSAEVLGLRLCSVLEEQLRQPDFPC